MFSRVIRDLPVAIAVSASFIVAADFPIQRVVIYKNGVALFERRGTVPAGEEAKLEFRTGDMNDILKSLTIVDSAGHRVNSVRYDSNESLDQRLRNFSFSLRPGELLSQILDQFRGAPVELKTGDRSLTGSILSARAIQTTEGNQSMTHREQVSLLTTSGEIVTIDLGAVSSIRFPDAKLQSQLQQYLQTVNESRRQDKRSVFIDAKGSGQQNLKIAYVTPAPIWKSSYRLTLNDAQSMIEGWAIVDNTTDEDWNNVQLSVVSGRPVSFISQLDTPRYGNRTVAELPEDAAAGPVVYGGAMDTKVGTGNSNGSNGAGQGHGMLRMAPAPQQKAAMNVTTMSSAQLMATTDAAPIGDSTVGEAAGVAVGELFEYNFREPLTIKRSQSAMIPFVQNRIAARKLLIYTGTGSEHPVNAAELTNTTAKTLDGGPLTVYEAGAYAGEALVEPLKAGDKRLVGYAVDYGTRITTGFGSSNQAVREIHGGEGVLHLTYADRQTKVYTINNVDTKAKTLVLQQESVGGYSVISPKPTERTSSAYRFEMNLEPNKSRTFNVEQERIYSETTQITSSTPDFLVNLTQNKQLSENGRKQLLALIDKKRQATEVSANLEATQNQMTALTADQTRLRQNIDSLNRVSGQEQQVRQYSAQLGANETQLAQLRDTQRAQAQRKVLLESEVREAISRLDF